METIKKSLSLLPMMVLTGYVMNEFIKPEKTDKKTGEVYDEQFKVQVLCQVPQQNGASVYDMRTFSVDQPELYKGATGKYIRVPVGAFINNGAVTFYALKGAKPEIVTFKNSGASA